MWPLPPPAPGPCRGGPRGSVSCPRREAEGPWPGGKRGQVHHGVVPTGPQRGAGQAPRGLWPIPAGLWEASGRAGVGQGSWRTAGTPLLWAELRKQTRAVLGPGPGGPAPGPAPAPRRPLGSGACPPHRGTVPSRRHSSSVALGPAVWPRSSVKCAVSTRRWTLFWARPLGAPPVRSGAAGGVRASVPSWGAVGIVSTRHPPRLRPRLAPGVHPAPASCVRFAEGAPPGPAQPRLAPQVQMTPHLLGVPPC